VTVRRDKFLIINQLDAPISQIYFGIKLYMFRTVPLSIIRSFSLYTWQWYTRMSYRFADSFRAGWNAVPSWSCSQGVSKTVWHIPLPCVQWKTPDDGQRNCPKHVEFHSKIKVWELVHLVGSIIRNRNNTVCVGATVRRLAVSFSHYFVLCLRCVVPVWMYYRMCVVTVGMKVLQNGRLVRFWKRTDCCWAFSWSVCNQNGQPFHEVYPEQQFPGLWRHTQIMGRHHQLRGTVAQK